MNDICVEPHTLSRESRIELWASNDNLPSSSLVIPIKDEESRLDVPFTSQSPHQNWNSPYDEAYEEASIIMAEFYLRGEDLTPEKADTEIRRLVREETELGLGIDISSWQAGKIANQIYGRRWDVYSGEEVTIDSIKNLLAKGRPVIIPVSGRNMNNPNFTGLGHPYHMIILTGYDRNNFFAHDPGTQFGENYTYPQTTVINAIHEWTGSKSTVTECEKAMLVLQKSETAGYVAAYGF